MVVVGYSAVAGARASESSLFSIDLSEARRLFTGGSTKSQQVERSERRRAQLAAPRRRARRGVKTLSVFWDSL